MLHVLRVPFVHKVIYSSTIVLLEKYSLHLVYIMTVCSYHLFYLSLVHPCHLLIPFGIKCHSRQTQYRTHVRIMSLIPATTTDCITITIALRLITAHQQHHQDHWLFWYRSKPNLFFSEVPVVGWKRKLAVVLPLQSPPMLCKTMMTVVTMMLTMMDARY